MTHVLAWEPQGNRFALLTSREGIRNVHFYSVFSEKNGAMVNATSLLCRLRAFHRR